MMNRAQLKAVGCISHIAVSFGDGHWYPTAKYGHARVLRPVNRGYCGFKVRGKMVKAHRHFYEKVVGPIASGLEPDHLCRDKACCAPAHIEPVTHTENVRRGDAGGPGKRKTHCKHGHEFTSENTYWLASGAGRSCRICQRAATARSYRKVKQQAAGELA